MIDTSQILIDGTLLTVAFSVFVIGSMLWNPRIWLHDFPPDLQALMPPKTDAEKRQTMLMAPPFFIILFGGLALTGLRYGTDNGLGWLIVHIYLAWQVVNLFDLIVIDWGGMHLVDPQHPPFPGTEGAAGYRDYRFHFVGFIKGSVMGVVIAAVTAGALWVVA